MYSLSSIVAAVVLLLVCVLTAQKIMQREERKRLRTEAALKKRVVYFENIFAQGHGESEDDLELPRHERKSAQRLLADAPKFGDGILRQTVGKATVITKDIAKRVSQMRGGSSAEGRTPHQKGRSRRPPPLQEQEEVEKFPGYIPSPTHSPVNSMGSSPVLGPQSPEDVGRPADAEVRPAKLPPPPAAAERRPAHLGPPRAHEQFSGSGATSRQQVERAQAGSVSPERAGAGRANAPGPAAKAGAGRGRAVYAKAPAPKRGGLGRG